MIISADLFLEVWESVSELIPNNKREDMAIKLVHIFADKGMDKDDFEVIIGEDDILDSVIESYYNGESTLHEYDDEDTDD